MRRRGRSVAATSFSEGASVLLPESVDVRSSGLPRRSTARLVFDGPLGRAPFGQDQVRLPGQRRVHPVLYLRDRLDDIRLLTSGVEDFSGERFDAPAQPELGKRARLKLTLRPLEFLELGQLREQGIGCVTDGLGVAHRVSLAGPPRAATQTRIRIRRLSVGAPISGRRGARRRACSRSARCRGHRSACGRGRSGRRR